MKSIKIKDIEFKYEIISNCLDYTYFYLGEEEYLIFICKFSIENPYFSKEELKSELERLVNIHILRKEEIKKYCEMDVESSMDISKVIYDGIY